MDRIPAGLRYSESHEWVSVEGGVATIGITYHAQEELGDVVFVELPTVGEQITRHEPFGVVESVKAASDILAPVSGAVTAVNADLQDRPNLVNQQPYAAGWMLRVTIADAEDLSSLLAASQYESFLTSHE